MSYRTILVHLDSSARGNDRVAFAVRWAKAHQAHLVGLVSSGLYDGLVIPAEAFSSGPSDFMARSAQFLAERTERISRSFREQVGEQVQHEVRVVDMVVIDALVRHGRCSDLVIVGQHDPSDPESLPVLGALPQRVLMETGCPVLMHPYAGRFDRMPRRVVVAWDGSREASMAVRAALPALARAAHVTVVSYGKPGAAQEDENADLQVPLLLQHLSRHGVAASAERDTVDFEIGDALLSRLADLDTDLLVMGGYGHSRFRELMLGGATRRVLESMTVPVFMAH